MYRGRKPDGDALQDAKGRPGKRRRATPPASSTVAATTIQPSSKLKQSALHVWRALAPELERLNFLRPTDANAFSRYCQTVARYWQVSEDLDREGETYTTDSAHGSMKRINPLFIIQERLSRRLTELEDRFGLTPAARQQIMLRLAQQQPSLPLAPGAAATPTDPPPPTDAGPIGILGTTTRH
jgi:P27 family predicted phage terminase small subunit